MTIDDLRQDYTLYNFVDSRNVTMWFGLKAYPVSLVLVFTSSNYDKNSIENAEEVDAKVLQM